MTKFTLIHGVIKALLDWLWNLTNFYQTVLWSLKTKKSILFQSKAGMVHYLFQTYRKQMAFGINKYMNVQLLRGLFKVSNVAQYYSVFFLLSHSKALSFGPCSWKSHLDLMLSCWYRSILYYSQETQKSSRTASFRTPLHPPAQRYIHSRIFIRPFGLLLSKTFQKRSFVSLNNLLTKK